MYTPDASAFAPLPQFISAFGLSDVLDVLPRLKNQLETVPAASGQMAQTSTRLNTLADTIDAQAATVQWQGSAAAHFQTQVSATTASLRQVAQTMTTTEQCTTQTANETLDTISWICLILAILAIVFDIMFAIAVAESWITDGTAFIGFLLRTKRMTATTVEVIIGALGTLLWMVQSFIDKYNGQIVTCNVPSPGGQPQGPTTPAPTTPSPRTSSPPPSTSPSPRATA